MSGNKNMKHLYDDYLNNREIHKRTLKKLKTKKEKMLKDRSGKLTKEEKRKLDLLNIGIKKSEKEIKKFQRNS
jgi:hypothetical protein